MCRPAPSFSEGCCIKVAVAVDRCLFPEASGEYFPEPDASGYRPMQLAQSLDEHLVVDVDRPVAYPPEDQRTDTAAVNIPDEGIGPAKPHGVPNRFASLSPARHMRMGMLSGAARAAAGARH